MAISTKSCHYLNDLWVSDVAVCNAAAFLQVSNFDGSPCDPSLALHVVSLRLLFVEDFIVFRKN